MAISKKHKFGLITFFILAITAIIVTIEPWNNPSGSMESAIVDAPPERISILWENLSAGYPETSVTDTIRSYKGFDLGYNEASEQASWVVYVLTRNEVGQGTVPRTDNFRTDTSISTGSAALTDYQGSGYDRGHLAPAGDMKWDKEAMSQSFLLSNMSPQNPSFNRGIWKKLEKQVRDWAVEKDSIYVITGPVLHTIESSIGENHVGIPGYYFKIVVDLSPPEHSMIAFLLPNEGSREELIHYAISVDSLELFTGYDFFAAAPDNDVIDWLEKESDFSDWK
ncbi:MAG: DNA/RNA non-specific endonuclease [Bacteroidetes bacterium]|nr:DNA/RNA non-specific endonuclease [Bacteroidota bacterium]